MGTSLAAASAEAGVSTENGAVIDAVAKLHEFQTLDLAALGAKPIAIVPQGKRVENLKPLLDTYLLKPERRRGTARLRDVASFIEMTLRYKSVASAVFAMPDDSAPKFTAVFDYHPSGDQSSMTDWMQHRAEYAPPLAEEWIAWDAQDGEWMNQAEFAAFLEMHATDLIVAKLDDPTLKTFADLVEGTWASPSDMIRLSRKLQVNVNAVVRNAQTISSGELSIVYEEVHTDGEGAPLKVPTLFTLAIPVFYLGGLYRIACQLRYRVAAGKILWMYQMVRPDLVFDDAFKGVVADVKRETALPVFIGSPEQ